MREFIENLTVHYQPILDIKTGKVVAAEALIRSINSNGEILLPDCFLLKADQANLMPAIGDFVVNKVIEDLPFMINSLGLKHISINTCATDLLESNNSSAILNRLEQYEHPEHVWIEITEQKIYNPRSILNNITKLRDRGYKVALDDFGAGYSNMSCIQELPIDIIKLDRSLTGNVNKSKTANAILSKAINIFKELNMEVVAEGVETIEQHDFHLASGADFVQGWLYSKAVSMDDFIVSTLKMQLGPNITSQGYQTDFPLHRNFAA